MMYLLKLLLYCVCLTTLNITALKTDASFEDADQVNEYITMSFSSSHPYDLRQTIPGEPEIDYPIYSAVPRTNFNCDGRHEGYYADTEARCQVFRICANTDLVGKGFAFLCPNGTLFSQKNFVCDWYRNVDCNDSERYYSKNDNNRIGTKTDMMKTVRQMMEHPMKTISIALNRGKSTTLQPTTYTNFAATRPTKSSINVQISSSPASSIPIQDNFNLAKQPINVNEVETASTFSSPLQEMPITGPTNILIAPLEGEFSLSDGGFKPSEGGFKPLERGFKPSEGGFKPSEGGSKPLEGGLFKPINISTINITPPSPTFTPPFETPISVHYESPLSSDNISYDTYSSDATQAGSPLSTSPINDSASSEKEVYISSLGELSTDPGANFNRQTSRVIADPPLNALDSETKSSNASGMNFAAKVNAGLNGLQVAVSNEVIAPEYVKNIMQNNIRVPDDIIQPVPFNYATNINSLLDEINYEAQNSVHFQEQQTTTTQQEAVIPVTKKPFRFLSRGFSHDKSKDGGNYVYGVSGSPRSAHRTTQHSTSTQSYSNSLITTLLLTTTQPPVTSTETTQNLTLENDAPAPGKLEEIQTAVKSNTRSEDPSFETNQSSSLVDDDKNNSSKLEKPQNDKTSKSQGLKNAKSELEDKLDSKPAIKREPKELKQLDSAVASQEVINEEDKVNANKRAEDLLLAGVKQITVNESDRKSKIAEDEVNLPIVPIYNRATGPQNSSPHITSSSTTSAISTTTTPSTMTTTTVSSSTTDIPIITSPSTTTVTFTPDTTTTASTTPAVSIRRFTVGSGKRQQNSRPISYSRRDNKKGSRTTSTTKSASTTPPTYNARTRLRSTSAPNTTKVPTTPRKRLNINRYTYGSRRRTTESTSLISSSTTTVAPPTKKLNVRSSESALSDLTAAASTNNAVSSRAYNSIRQNSYKYTQTKRLRPIHKNITSQTTTTTKPLLKNPTTQQPRSSPSYPTPTLAPFSHHEALSPMPTSSTTPKPLPATFLSFNDLTKSITDDSILQTLRNNQAFNRQLVDSSALRSQQQALPRQQIPFSTVPRIQQGYSTQRPSLSVPTSLPFIPLKDFIASKFGAQYSPEPPKLSTGRPALITTSLNDDYALKPQNKPVLDQHYLKQQYAGVRQEFVPQTNQAVQISSPVQYTVRTPVTQNVFQQQSQLSVQQQQQQQQQLQQQQLLQEQQLRLQQQQQKLQQLKQQQNHLQQQYQLQQQQKLQQQQQHQQQKLQQQLIQQNQVPQQQYFSTNQQQIFPAQQYSQVSQTVPVLQQQQQIPTQQHRNSLHQVSTKIVPSVEQQFQIQRSQQIQTSISSPPNQQQHQRQHSQIQIIPSQMTMAETIPPQQSNINVKTEIGSINVRLPSNLAGLIPNTNIFELSRNSNSLQSAQRRSDQSFEDAYGARERKSVFAGVSSYDVPLSSVGRLTNDITHFLRQRRL